MKRIVLVFSLLLGLVAFSLLLIPKPAHAGSESILIRILVKKGILTQQEADEIMKEAKKEEAKKKNQMKVVAVEAVKKEIKEDKDFKEEFVPRALKGLKIGLLSYIDFSTGKSPLVGGNEQTYTEMKLTRGYLTVKKDILPWLSGRMTYDIHREASGDIKGRIKYLYAELRPKNLGPLTDMKIEIGQGHIPWLDFEEHVNPYRMQGTMAIERAGVFNSADLGISIRGYLGRKLQNAKELIGNTHYDGKYGSWHIGIYNGAGYHRGEHNTNKVLEGRLTLRPLPAILPGLQLSYFGLIGEGDTKAVNGNYPDYEVNLFMLSYQRPDFIFTGQYFRTKGNAKGTWVDVRGDALRTGCYSFFMDYRLPVILFSAQRLHIFGRYDHFDQDINGHITDHNTAYRMYIFGFGYDVYKENKLILTFEKTDYGTNAGEKGGLPVIGNNLGDEYKWQMVWQLHF